MLQSAFYHNTTRKYVAAFGSIFNAMRIERENLAGEVIDTIPVPLMYSGKEKFIQRANQISSIDEQVRLKEVLPAMGFELLDITYSPIRKTNTMHRLVSRNGDTEKFMFNRVPYDFTFALYIAGRRVDDVLRIVEQIFPYFSPELNIRIQGMKDFPEMVDDITLILDQGSLEADASGPIEERRVVNYTLNFTLKGFLYTNVRDASLIKKTTVDLSNEELNTFYEGYLSYVDPLNAAQRDNPDIKEVITDIPRVDSVVEGAGGSAADATMG